MPISKTGMKRLYRLVEFMESLPKSANKHFDMCDFYSHEGEGHVHKLPANPTPEDLHACGTTACALGWAVTVPAFRKAGLCLKVEPSAFSDREFYRVENSEQVFGLPQDMEADESDYWESLFGSGNRDSTPKEWAKRVRKLLKKWSATA